MTSWDTFGFFEACLSRFRGALLRARQIASVSGVTVHDAIAVDGFAGYQPANAWAEEHASFIRDRVAGELSLEALEWFEDSAEAVSIFCCFVLGALLGKAASREIDAAGFLLGDAHLSAFVLDNSERVHARFEGSD